LTPWSSQPPRRRTCQPHAVRPGLQVPPPVPVPGHPYSCAL